MENILNKYSLKGKVAIVTGAGQGIGRAISIAFAQAGAQAAISDQAHLKNTSQNFNRISQTNFKYVLG